MKKTIATVVACLGLALLGPSIPASAAEEGPYATWTWACDSPLVFTLYADGDFGGTWEYFVDDSIYGEGGQIFIPPFEVRANWTASLDRTVPHTATLSFPENNKQFHASIGACDEDTAPTASIVTPADGSTLLLGEPVTADYSCSDEEGGSGITSCTGTVPTGDAVDTSTLGAHLFEVVATDNAQNTATVTSTYRVGYGFSGFSSPVDEGMTNSAKAGRTVPFKFSAFDGAGTPVTTLTAVTARAVQYSCGAGGTATDSLEEYAAGGSGLQNLGGGLYQYNVKTDKSWAGTCRTLGLDLGDGIQRTADFAFVK